MKHNKLHELLSLHTQSQLQT